AQPPDEIRPIDEEQRSRLQAVLLEGGEHDRRRRRGWTAEGEEADEGAGGGSVVGSPRPGDAFDGAIAEFLRILGKPLLGGIGQVGADLGAAGRHGADGKALRSRNQSVSAWKDGAFMRARATGSCSE